MGRYMIHRVNNLTSFILSSALSSLGTNKYPKLKIKINRRGVAKSWASKLMQHGKNIQLMNCIYLEDSRKGTSQQKFE